MSPTEISPDDVLLRYAASNHRMAGVCRKIAEHIDKTNAASVELSATRDSALATATGDEERAAIRDTYATGLTALQANYYRGMDFFTGEMREAADAG
jgi:hypothetical protein